MSIGKIQKTQEIAAEKIAACFFRGKHYQLRIGTLAHMPFHTMKQLSGSIICKEKKVSGLPFIFFLFKKE